MRDGNAETIREEGGDEEPPSIRYPWARSPWFAAFVTLLITVTGIMGSVWSPEIRSTFGSVHLPALGFDNPPFNLEATVFWGFLFVSVILFWIQRDAQYTAREKAQSDLERSQRDLQETTSEIRSSAELLHQEIRTMPPPHFLRTYGRAFGKVERTVNAIARRQNPSAEEVRMGIRVILLAILELTKTFDDVESERYAANVMTYHAADDLTVKQRRSLQTHLRFVDDAVSIERLRGVLVLQTDLSFVSNADGKGLTPDPELSPIVLGIPNVGRKPRPIELEEDFVYVLPGAPLAWEDNETYAYVNTQNVLHWSKRHGDFTRQVIRQLRDYFGSEAPPVIGSFYSSPIVFDEGGSGDREYRLSHPSEPSRPDGKGGRAIGVLNVHRMDEGILMGQRTAAVYFTDVTRPFRLLLARLLYRLQEVDENEHPFISGSEP